MLNPKTGITDKKPRTDVQRRYEAALDALTEKLVQDRYILAAIVYGSVARGEAWEKSDIDMDIIQQDGLGRDSRYCTLVEDGIIIPCSIMSRNHFKRIMDGSLQGSIAHSIRSHARLLLCKDESIATWFNESDRIGKRDQEFQLMRVGSNVPPLLYKAEKWFYAKHDLDYAFLWILYTVNSLARIEVVLNGEAPGREVIDQALKYNPDFFSKVYTDLIHGPKGERDIQQALDRITTYMEERTERIFRPILDYLNEADGARTLSEMNENFRKKIASEDHFFVDLTWAYEWLAERRIIEKVASPIRLTRKSQVVVEEPAYFYDDDEFDWE